MSAIAIKEMKNDETMWQRYYSDFTYYYLHLSANPDSLEYKLLQKTFFDVFNDFNEVKVIAAHCYLHLNQIDMAEKVASLKSLQQLRVCKEDQEPLHPESLEASLISTLVPSESDIESSVSQFVIKLLFEALVKAICTKDLNSRLSNLEKWFNSYRDTVSSYNDVSKIQM